MNRPRKEDKQYNLFDEWVSTTRFFYNSYIKDLNKYCDELENKINELEEELELYKKTILIIEVDEELENEETECK